MELTLRELHVSPEGGAPLLAKPPLSFEIGNVREALQPESPTTIAGGDAAEVPPGAARRIVVHYANPTDFPRSGFPYSVRAVFVVDTTPMSAVATIRRACRYPVP